MGLTKQRLRLNCIPLISFNYLKHTTSNFFGDESGGKVRPVAMKQRDQNSMGFPECSRAEAATSSRLPEDVAPVKTWT